jgi:hypothetical protein
MKRAILIALVMAVLLVSQTQAGPGGCTNNGSLASMGDEQITVSNAAIPFTATIYAPAGVQPADMAQIVIETNAARYRDNGLAPTAAVGYPIAVGTPYMVCGTLNIRRAQFIRSGAADGTLNVIYYRRGDQ